MSKKNNLFSIGEISEVTGASIKSLRYYEKIKILTPAYIDPYSGYRYYSFDQANLVSIIMYCIELDIPLKELTRYIDKDQTVDFSAFLSHGKEIAQKKLKVLQMGLGFIEALEMKIAQTNKHRQKEGVYTMEIPEKKFWVIPYRKSFQEEVDQLEMIKPFLDWNNRLVELYESVEYGYLCEYSGAGVRRYVFAEIPSLWDDVRTVPQGSIKLIPGGSYFCRQSERSRIEEAPEIFAKHLGNRSFLAIETEVLSGKFKINKPLHELRVIAAG